MTGTAPPAVAIVLLNWNGWEDTVECLESCLSLDYPAVKLIVCDNASTDGSIERISDWAAGHAPATPAGATGRGLIPEASRPPVSCTLLRSPDAAPAFQALPDLTLIDTGSNRGFAGGCNIGLSYALDAGAQYVWLLNNDTVVTPGALSALVARLDGDPALGFCGSRIAFYDVPDRLQLVGGCAYYPWIASARRLGADMAIEHPFDPAEIERRMAFVSGASCLVSRTLLEEVGLMNEAYFLYCEEIDWALRAGTRFRSGVAIDSLIYHKAGSAIGSKRATLSRSATSAYYLSRASRMVARRYHAYGLPGLFGVLCLTALRDLVTGYPGTAFARLRGFWGLARR